MPLLLRQHWSSPRPTRSSPSRATSESHARVGSTTHRCRREPLPGLNPSPGDAALDAVLSQVSAAKAVVQVAMLAGLPYTVLRDAIFTHPTLPEGLIPLFAAVAPKK